MRIGAAVGSLAAVAVLALAGWSYFHFRVRPLAPVRPSFVTISTSTGDMALVPEGRFLLGSQKESVPLAAYYVDCMEVTNQQYAAFCDATQHELPPDFPSDKPGYPVVNVTMLDAQAYAKWAGKRIPTAREWEKAARGTDGRLYPWGNKPDSRRTNVGTGELHPAGDYASGASPYGAVNMIGNAGEWVQELVDPTDLALEQFRASLKPAPTIQEPWYLVRGLSFRENWRDSALYDYTVAPARWRNVDVGFRCVKDAE